MHPQTLQNLRDRVFYHGTDRTAAAAIVAGGFRLRFYRGGGHLGLGIYVTANPGTALYFGPVVLEVRTTRHLRLLDITTPFDPGIIDSLTHDFGREILRKPPRMVLPRNKHLKREEIVALFTYHQQKGHYNRCHRGSRYPDTLPASLRLHREMRSLLIRAGFHGYGRADDDTGIVLFADDCIHAADVVVDVPEAESESESYYDFESFGWSGYEGSTADDEGSPHRTVSAVEARLAELFPRKSAIDWQGNVLAPKTETQLQTI